MSTAGRQYSCIIALVEVSSLNTPGQLMLHPAFEVCFLFKHATAMFVLFEALITAGLPC